MNISWLVYLVVCFMGFQESVGSSNRVRRSIEWPEQCAGKSYCTVKTADYPSDQTLIAALRVSSVNPCDLIEPPQPAESRISNFLCLGNISIDPVYMIKDENNTIRFAVQLPSVFQFRLRIEECKSKTDFDVKCVERTIKWKYLVLTEDAESVEIALPAGGIPVACVVDV